LLCESPSASAEALHCDDHGCLAVNLIALTWYPVKRV